ncbi:SMC family ATPase [Nocardioides sp. 1609]|uniref:AAA family ATPase n=1 Tax=Nocardioides sp. 1609 TaxID=2508327 RepID=UPI00106F5F4D|nr:SMC family ATPase [Nocardioides sp. 1609]
MRLHRLEIQAFGPFAGAATIDFDDLSEAGLFLLSGATGAGKTSVLDAVCFALYGDVPGDRSQAKRLRSDQADPTTPPRVTLEATLAGRRFRIVRSPAWERPKKRGAGTTTEPAKVTVSERVGPDWQPLSSRLDETGDLVVRLLGLDLTQFTQVAMLPQGRFQAFLRARSDERHRLLQQLFRTGRFEAVERWLRERRIALGHESAAGHQRVADVVSRVSEAAATPLPDHVDVHDLAPAVDDDTLRAWVEACLADAVSGREESQARLTAAGVEEQTARAALEAARADVARRERLVAARQERDVLLGRTAAHRADRARLDAARRAAVVVPWRHQAQAAGAAATRAGAAADAALAAVADRLGEVPDPDRLSALADRSLAAAAEARAQRPHADRLAAVRRALRDNADRRTQLADELGRVQHERAVRPDRVAALRAEVAHARDDARRVDVLTASAQDARSRLDAHEQVVVLRARLQEVRERWLQTREQTFVLKDELLAVQRLRLDGMAAELAVALVVGGCCPVCGSGDHPAKARPAPGAPDAATEKTALNAVADAEVVEHALDQQVRELEQSLAAAEARVGDDPVADLAARLATLQDSLGAALRSAGRLPELEARLSTDERALVDLEHRCDELLAADFRLVGERGGLTQEEATLGAELAAVLGDHPDLDAVHDAHRRTAELCRAAARAAEEARTAAGTQVAADRAVAAAVADAGFEHVADAQAATLEAGALRALDEAVTRHERRLEAVTEVLRDAGPDDAVPLPDVDLLERRHVEVLARVRTAASDVSRYSARTERLAGLLATLDAELAAWAPVRRDHGVVARLSAFVEGKSADNLLKMRLSAYVLAYRLSQVVAAANERLARMSDQRYSLEHTGQRGAGESRGGLSLLVRDDWSGESRDPATLSGGETFVVSLALALGLADVISHEAGGATLDTLFVDEGFGSLDADTLDDVMDTLDSLRDGGRVVGVVSHVAEMRDRIPTQLHVAKHRRGSTVSLRR